MYQIGLSLCIAAFSLNLGHDVAVYLRRPR